MPGNADRSIVPAGPEAAEALAALHARCFADLPETPWSPAAFRTLLALPNVAALAARDAAGAPVGLAIGRQGGGEGEILTLCVAPECRRTGIARALVAGLFAALGPAERLFLEVAATNQGARALYAGLGFRPVGRRPGYYRGGETPVDALVLACPRPDAPAPLPDACK